MITTNNNYLRIILVLTIMFNLLACDVNIRNSQVSERDNRLTLASKKEANQYIKLNRDTNIIEMSFFNILKSNTKEPYRVRTFKRSELGFYEVRLPKDFENNVLDTINLLMLSTKVDTSYKFIFNIDKYPPLHPIGSEDFFLTISKKSEDNYRSEKVYLNNTRFREIIEYDSNYNITSFIKIENNDTLEFKNR